MATTTIFDCQYDTTNYNNSVVIGRTSTTSDIGSLVVGKDLEFENEIFLQLNSEDKELESFIEDYNLIESRVNCEGNPCVLNVNKPAVWFPLLTDFSHLGTTSTSLTNHNSTFVASTDKFGSCCYFNGNQQWVQWNRSLGSFYNNDWTIMCWLKPMDNTRSIIISEYSGTGSSNVTLELSAQRVVRLYWNGTPDIYFTAGGALVLGEWTHVAVTKSGRVVKFYLNGELKQTYTNSSDFTTQTSSCQPRLGDDYRGNSANSVSYNGYMADFRAYESCLLDEEIRSLAMEAGIR